MKVKHSAISILIAVFSLTVAIDVSDFKLSDQNKEHARERLAEQSYLNDLSHQYQASSFRQNKNEVQKYTVFFGQVLEETKFSGRSPFRFCTRIQGVSGTVVANADKKFISILKSSGKPESYKIYKTIKKRYTGGVSVPFITFLGFNEKMSSPDVASQSKSIGVTTYKLLCEEASNILQRFSKRYSTINGTIRFPFQSSPITFSVYLKTATVDFGQNQTIKVYSAVDEDSRIAGPIDIQFEKVNRSIAIQSYV